MYNRNVHTEKKMETLTHTNIHTHTDTHTNTQTKTYTLPIYHLGLSKMCIILIFKLIEIAETWSVFNDLSSALDNNG